MSNTGSNYIGTLDSDGKLYIISNMNDWHLISTGKYVVGVFFTLKGL